MVGVATEELWSSESLSSSQSPSSSSSARDGEGDAEAAGDGSVELAPLPVKLASTPAACIRAIASAFVSQARLVPALATKGRATQIWPALQGVNAHLPWTHCANMLLTHASCPSE